MRTPEQAADDLLAQDPAVGVQVPQAEGGLGLLVLHIAAHAVARARQVVELLLSGAVLQAFPRSLNCGFAACSVIACWSRDDIHDKPGNI